MIGSLIRLILSPLRKPPDLEPVRAVYRSIVAQSRRPVFYAEWGVPDTATGRFDMISLHLILLFRRMRRESEHRFFTQQLHDIFFQDMDRSLREMGVSDLGVPKKIEKMVSLHYGLMGQIVPALDRDDLPAVEAALERNVFAGATTPDIKKLATYLREEAQRLADRPAAAIVAEAQPA